MNMEFSAGPRWRLRMNQGRLALCCFLLAMACEPKEPERAHPGCPGESFRSATSKTDCVCGKGEVLRAGALECKACDPVPSAGIYCECDSTNFFSFDGSLQPKLGLSSDQVSCGEPSDCEPGERYDRTTDSCAPCGANDCGGECGDCPVARACVSGQCAVGEVCKVSDIAFGSGSHGIDDTCSWGTGEITSVDPLTSYPGSDCSFADEKCEYTAKLLPLGGFEPSCPDGTKESPDDPDLCVCNKAGDVMYAGLLECEYCDPVASRGLYCDCGENAVFSNHWLLESILQYASPRVQCAEPSAECADGQFMDWSTGACTACIAGACGQGCLCPVGSTCVSGACSDGAAGRVRSVRMSSTIGKCLFKSGDLLPLGSINQFVPGETYDWPEYDGCVYEVTAEALSR